MKYIKIIIILALGLIITGCGNKKDDNESPLVNGKIPYQVINSELNIIEFCIGDINGDGIFDTATLITPIMVTDSNGTHCETNCYCTIFFDALDDGIIHNDAKKGIIMDAGDLNKDLRSEIAFIPTDNENSWTNIYIYSIKEDGWHIISTTPILYEKAKDSIYQNSITILENNSYSVISNDYDTNGLIIDVAIEYFDF